MLLELVKKNKPNEKTKISYHFYTTNSLADFKQIQDLFSTLLTLKNNKNESFSIIDDFCSDQKVEKMVIFSIWGNKMNLKQNISYLNQSQEIQKISINNNMSPTKKKVEESDNVELLERLNLIERKNEKILLRMKKVVECLKMLRTSSHRLNPTFSMKKIEKMIGNTINTLATQ